MSAYKYHRHHHQHHRKNQPGLLATLWTSFWEPPEVTCPKCRGEDVTFYDPFLFNPLRTMAGKRRIQCHTCGFIWRPSRKGRSFFDNFRFR